MKKYNIALNGLALKTNLGGIESSYFNTVKFLTLGNPNNNYYLYIGKNSTKIFESLKKLQNLKIIVYPIDSNNSPLRVFTEHTLLFLGLIKNRIDIVHHLCNYMPRFNPCKTITTVHDLAGFFYHENFPPTKMMERFYKHMKSETGFTIKYCNRIIAISEFTKSKILKYYPYADLKKITIIGQSLDSRKEFGRIKKEYLLDLNIKKPYLFSSSIVRPHKNYEFLIKTFNNLKEKYDIPHQLVIAGGMGNEMKQRRENLFLSEIERSPYNNDIKYLGYTDNKYMSTLYNYADLYITPSIYEGFGMTVLEAMKYGVPIACSNAASLPEVGGDGCIYFDPFDIEDASEKIYSLLNNKELQNKIKSHQKERLELFSWENIAKQINTLYQEVLEGK